MSKNEIQDQYNWVVKVIRSCTTKKQLDSALKLVVNYFNLNIYKPEHRHYDRYMMLTSSPLYGELEHKEIELKTNCLI